MNTALKKAGLNRNTACYWQNNTTSPCLKSVWKLAKYNDISIAEIISVLGYTPPNYPNLEAPISLIKLIQVKGYNQTRIANDLSVSRNTVWSWIHSDRSPNLVLALSLCHLLKVTIDDLASSLNFDHSLPPEPTTQKKRPLKELFAIAS